MSVKYFDKEQNKWVAFPGTQGAPGEDAYDIAVRNGFKGTYEEYVEMISKMPGYIEDIEGIIDGSGAFVKAEGDINEDHLAVFKDNNTIKDGGITIKDVIDKVVNGLEGDLIDPSMLSASVENVVETDGEVLASVNYEDKNFAFSFGIPKGIKGDKGDKGDTGESGVSARTVLAFTTSDTKPARPVGGSWDILTNEVTLPSGWSMSDEIAKPVWMCSGVFYNADPDNPVWGDTSLISGTDGDNGADGTSVEFIYKLTPDHTNIYKPERPTQNTQTDVAPEGWTDSPSGISEEMQCEWFCTRKWSDNGWSDWDGPYIWSKWGANGLDGDGVQYVYYLNDGEPVSNPTISDYATNDAYQERGAYDGVEYCPASPWTDEPSGVTPDNKCEWVSVRKFRDGKWGPYSDPKLWARYGESGVSGLISRSKYAITDSSSVVPAFNKNEKNPGSIWYSTLESAMAHYEYPQAMWSITAYFDRNNDFAEFVDENGNSVIGWQGPIIISGTKGDQGPIGPQGIQGEAGATGPEGPNGPMGVAGVGMEFRYCRGTSDAPEYPSVEDITYGTDSKDNGKATPDGWHWNTENMVLEGDYLYVWCIQGKKKYNDDKDSYSIDWQAAFRLSGLNGSEKGDQGEAGPVVYPAGYWNENQNYEIKDGLCPYVYYEGNFYILNATPSTGHNPEEYPKIWVKMESFEAIYADVGVFKQALVGSAVFHGDYVYSQQGINGTNYTESKVSDVDGKPSDFTPNILFNFKTGAGHLAGGKIEFTSDGKLNFGQGVLPEGGSGGSGDVTDYDRIQDMIDDSVSNTETEFQNKINNVITQLNKKADSSDIPTDYVTSDVIDDIYDAIDSIDTHVSASEVVDALDNADGETLSDILNGKLIIDGTSIGENSIATRHLGANSVTTTVLASGAVIADKIASNAITADKIQAKAITAEKIKGLPSGLTIQSHDTDSNSTWILRSNGSARFGRENGNKITIGSDGTVTITADNVGGSNIVDQDARDALEEIKDSLSAGNTNIKDLQNKYNNMSDDIAGLDANIKAYKDAGDATSAALAEYKRAVNENLNNLQGLYTDVNTELTTVDELLGTWKMPNDTTINGANIHTGTITAGAIAAGAINTALIEGGALTGLTIDSGNGRWELNSDGSGELASGAISWGKTGNITFGSGVTISWSSDQQDQVNNAINTANTAITDAADAQSLANTANQNASKAQSTANSASTKADNAQSTANTASSKADSAQEKANSAYDLASSAKTTAEAAAKKTISSTDVINALKTGNQTTLNDIINGQVTIQGTAIADGAIVSNKIAANAITAEKIKTGSITIGKMDENMKTMLNSIPSDDDIVAVVNGGLKAKTIIVDTAKSAESLTRALTVGDISDLDLNKYSTKDALEAAKTALNTAISKKADTSSLSNYATKSEAEDYADAVYSSLTEAVNGTTYIKGGLINTNAITVRPSQLVDDSNNPVTIITPTTLATTNVYAEKLRVEGANIQNLKVDNISNIDSYVPGSVQNDSATINASGVNITVGDTIFKVNSNGIYVQDSSTEGLLPLYQYVMHQYKQANYTIEETSSEYEYQLESSGDNISFSVVSGSTNSVELPNNEYVTFILNGLKRDCVTPINYVNGEPHRGSTTCGSWYNPLIRTWTASAKGGVTATINGEELIIRKTSSGSVNLTNGTGETLTFNVV